ncbi:MAG: diaminopimelate epimerase [Betaproteobacteria bacterium]|nr:diaminopimelate epimerase [Betaproteobacteria bacterium]
MRLRFTKMQGSGNDFVVLDGVRQRVALTPAVVRQLADRHFGIGADQVLLVEPSPAAGIDFRYRIFNADGDEVEHCGNGARCFVRYVRDHGLTDRDTVRVQTLSGVLELSIAPDGRVSVDMGQPILEPPRVPFDATGLAPRTAGADTLWPLELGEAVRWVSALSMGNPHAVLTVEDVERAPVQAEGAQIEHHRRFPRRVNVGFMQVTGPHSIALRVWERGVGETLACGTGACAAAVAAIRQQRVASPVDVHMRGGVVSIAWQPGESVRMIGPATTVFEGDIELQQDGPAQHPPVISNQPRQTERSPQ